MANRAHKIRFRWDAVVLGTIALALVLCAVPLCTGLNGGAQSVTAKTWDRIFPSGEIHAELSR